MLCAKCGYIVSKRQDTCPKCKNPLSDETGEWSDSSSMEIPAPVKEDTKPPDNEVEKAAEKKSEEPVKSVEEKTELDDVKKSTSPKKKKAPPEKSEPGPLFRETQYIKGKTSTPRTETPDDTPEEPAEEKPATRPAKPYTVPEPYIKGDATFSSELSTDWIERYSKARVSPLPESSGLGVRFWAGALDWMLVIAIGALAMLAGRLLLSLLGDSQHTSGQLLQMLAWPVGGFWFVMVVVYFTIFITTTGQTPGCIVMGIRVYDSTANQPPGIGKAFIRAMVFIGGLLLLGAGCWVAVFDKSRLTWQDKVAGTRVIPLLNL